MKHLQALKDQLAVLKSLSMVYHNELGDSVRVSELDAKIKKLDGMILRLMTLEQQINVARAKIA